jgi:hypothetical protein
VLVNIGEAHGVQAGDRFLVYGPPETIEVGGRSIERLGQPIGTLTVTEVSEESALAQVNTEGAGLEPGLRIKEAPPLEE